MLTNFASWGSYVNSSKEGHKSSIASGWSPACTLKTILL